LPPSSVAPLPPAPVPNEPGPKRNGAARLAGAVLLCAAVSAGVSYGTVQLTDRGGTVNVVPSAGGTAVLEGDVDLHDLLEATQPAVTAIELAARDGDTTTEVAAGSGVIISTDGLMLTNAHVVDATDGAGNRIDDPVITVKMFDGSVRSAEVLGVSADYDIALLRLDDTTDLTALPLADASTFRVGDEVVAIGNALDLGDAPTVSTGIISAIDRTLQVNDSVTLRGLIQTDAAINHGNSGGALVNAAGQLVGINSAGIPDAQNIGFAISVGTIAPLLADLEAGNEVAPPAIGYIGVTLAQTPDGIQVQEVQPGTPAATAGIESGDLLVTVNGTKVRTTNQLATVLRDLAPGSDATIVVQRDGREVTVELTLAQRPNA
ncbi:MAG: hypothetical protein RI900_1894, partial [Actinomycetota bacterium]